MACEEDLEVLSAFRRAVMKAPPSTAAVVKKIRGKFDAGKLSKEISVPREDPDSTVHWTGVSIDNISRKVEVNVLHQHLAAFESSCRRT